MYELVFLISLCFLAAMLNSRCGIGDVWAQVRFATVINAWVIIYSYTNDRLAIFYTPLPVFSSNSIVNGNGRAHQPGPVPTSQMAGQGFKVVSHLSQLRFSLFGDLHNETMSQSDINCLKSRHRLYPYQSALEQSIPTSGYFSRKKGVFFKGKTWYADCFMVAQ